MLFNHKSPLIAGCLWLPVVELEQGAVIGSFSCLYHITKSEQARHTNYPALLELAELLGCDYFKKLEEKVAFGIICVCFSLFNIRTYFVLFNQNLLKLEEGAVTKSQLIINEMLKILSTVG